ncbi:MAG: CDP-alcohol phosphatidyltransferase family protein [Patescibacteria group bacterium]
MQDQAVFSPYDRVLRYLLPIVPRALKPNHVTFFRLIFSPAIVVLLVGNFYFPALFVFVFLAFTDMLDGAMARLRGEVTEWGKVWDPIADKLLIGQTMLVLLAKINFTLTILILSFEMLFVVGGVFLKLKNKNIEIKANTYGKIKMNLQCFGLGLIFLGKIYFSMNLLFCGQLLLYLSLFFAVFSIIKKGI